MKTKEISQIVNFVIKTELEQFKQDFDLQPIPESQDIGSLSIAWLCYYCKDNIDLANRDDIANFVNLVMNSETYRTEGWSRIPALQAASFALTGHKDHLNDLLKNLSCHQSTNREFITKSLSIICPLIPFENDYFRESVKKNLRLSNGLDEIGVILYLNSDGEHEEKERWLKETFESSFLNRKTIFDDLIERKSITEDFFKDTFNEIKSHILFRILKHSYLYNNQTNIFQEGRVYPKTLNTFYDDHPLDFKTFTFNFNRE